MRKHSIVAFFPFLFLCFQYVSYYFSTYFRACVCFAFLSYFASSNMTALKIKKMSHCEIQGGNDCRLSFRPAML